MWVDWVAHDVVGRKSDDLNGKPEEARQMANGTTKANPPQTRDVVTVTNRTIHLVPT